MYPILALIFFLSIFFGLSLIVVFIFKPQIWRCYSQKIWIFCTLWFVPYFIFILFFTGPNDFNKYPSHENSPYMLPWEAGVARILSQGNRSFTSHRGIHLYAWDFVMPNGSMILAARDGVVIEVEQGFSMIGLRGNYILILHADNQISGYFHIQYKGAMVTKGDHVEQGQFIALSGMTGQTTLPHLHFVVFNFEQTSSVPISFKEVRENAPLAGRFYTSENKLVTTIRK